MSTTTTDYAQGFATLSEEVSLDRLPLRGALPDWLEGTLLRTGPARWEIGASTLTHWFDGLAMLHAFSFAGGEVSYANRFLASRARQAADAAGRQVYGEFATDPCRSIFQRVHALFRPQATDNGNVNVARLGERFVALTETPMAVEFDPATLATLGFPRWAPGHVTTAHPHADRASGEAINYTTRLGPSATYRVYGLSAPGAQPRAIATVPARPAAYMHSFGLSERFVVLAEFPLVLHPRDLVLGRAPFADCFAWEPERGTILTVVDRRDGTVRGRFGTDPFFAFHHINAFEQGDRLVVDLCAYADAAIVRSLFLDRLRGEAPRGDGVPDAFLTRCEVDLASGRVELRRLSETPLELPRINYSAVNERSYRWVWGAARGADAPADAFIDRIVKIDVDSGAAATWSQPGCWPGEPVFVAAPEATEEDDGVCLSVVLDGGRGASFLLVLDARDLSELARAEVPHHIPFGFHGQFARGR
ncbi:carotenoid oxygenase family protein [Conexibacter arvalis]|uniref:Dioxygenase n=1 Tax=Conexibacter arvalis TaxID=912552 RepID=A0A840I7V8_9ACTN|nr:carotenoid oxygenase family protein [Conexibacter arvalis]MBB4660956.1 carotenoid cleavage dioxygenase-like enzyme [Conexibacter arvalis]